jgi:hypothetical protein
MEMSVQDAHCVKETVHEMNNFLQALKVKSSLRRQWFLNLFASKYLRLTEQFTES